MVPCLLLAACSSPLRETSEPSRSAEPSPSAEEATASSAPSSAPAPSDVATAAQPAPPASPKAQPPPEPPAEKPKAAPALAQPDPVKEVLAEEAQRVEREQMIVRLAAERDAAADVVARRQKDLLAFKNPFLPRPQLTPEEADEIKGLGGAARAQWAERRVDDAKALLDAAQKAYDDARAPR